MLLEFPVSSPQGAAEAQSWSWSYMASTQTKILQIHTPDFLFLLSSHPSGTLSKRLVQTTPAFKCILQYFRLSTLTAAAIAATITLFLFIHLYPFALALYCFVAEKSRLSDLENCHTSFYLMGCEHLVPSIILGWAQCPGTAVTTEVFQPVLPSGCSLKPSEAHDSLQSYWPTWLTGQYVQLYCLPWLHTVTLSSLESLGFL